MFCKRDRLRIVRLHDGCVLANFMDSGASALGLAGLNPLNESRFLAASEAGIWGIPSSWFGCRILLVLLSALPSSPAAVQSAGGCVVQHSKPVPGQFEIFSPDGDLMHHVRRSPKLGCTDGEMCNTITSWIRQYMLI